MTRQDDTRAWTEQQKVESAILGVAIERRRIATEEMLGEVVVNPDDEHEVQMARRAISSLCEYGLLAPEREDGMLAATPAAVHGEVLRI